VLDVLVGRPGTACSSKLRREGDVSEPFKTCKKIRWYVMVFLRGPVNGGFGELCACSLQTASNAYEAP